MKLKIKPGAKSGFKSKIQFGTKAGFAQIQFGTKAHKIMNQINKIKYGIWSQTLYQIRSQVEGQVEGQVRSQIADQIGKQVGNQITFRGQIRN